MPVVPITRGPTSRVRSKPDDSFILMAAAQMAAERAPPIAKPTDSPTEAEISAAANNR